MSAGFGMRRGRSEPFPDIVIEMLMLTLTTEVDECLDEVERRR